MLAAEQFLALQLSGNRNHRFRCIHFEGLRLILLLDRGRILYFEVGVFL